MAERGTVGAEEADGGCPDLSADEWEAVAGQLCGANDGSWRDVLRGVCRSARGGMDVAPTTTKGGRWMDPGALATRVELLCWAAEQGCELLDDGRVPLAAMEGWACCSGAWSAAAGSCPSRETASEQPGQDSRRCCSGQEGRATPEMAEPAQTRRVEDILTSCTGQEGRADPGISGPVR
eukprot:jgi/Tetstr1/443210/TSEL_031250.t1